MAPLTATSEHLNLPCRSLAQARDDLAESLRTAPLTLPARDRLAAMLRGIDELLGKRAEHGRGEG